jgi:hypothetical protein
VKVKLKVVIQVNIQIIAIINIILHKIILISLKIKLFFSFGSYHKKRGHTPQRFWGFNIYFKQLIFKNLKNV